MQNLPDEEIKEIIEFYDCREIQPIGNNQHLIVPGRQRMMKVSGN